MTNNKEIEIILELTNGPKSVPELIVSLIKDKNLNIIHKKKIRAFCQLQTCNNFREFNLDRWKKICKRLDPKKEQGNLSRGWKQDIRCATGKKIKHSLILRGKKLPKTRLVIKETKVDMTQKSNYSFFKSKIDKLKNEGLITKKNKKYCLKNNIKALKKIEEKISEEKKVEFFSSSFFIEMFDKYGKELMFESVTDIKKNLSLDETIKDLISRLAGASPTLNSIVFNKKACRRLMLYLNNPEFNFTKIMNAFHLVDDIKYEELVKKYFGVMN